MGCLSESRSKKPMEVEFRKARLARSLRQQNARLVLGSKQVASAAKTPKRVVMQKLRHNEIILEEPDDVSWLPLPSAASGIKHMGCPILARSLREGGIL
jgi:hypothetical protein